MIRIRKISNPLLNVNAHRIEQVKEVLKIQFPGLSEKKAEEFVNQLTDSLKYKFQTSLFVAEDINDKLRGFAILMYMPDLSFCFLDFIAVIPGKSSSGIGGAIYERVKEEAISLNVSGLFFECLPDDPALCENKENLLQNKKRLAFYEKFGARPIINTKYEAKVNPDDDCPPYLVLDNLGKNETISKITAKKIFRAILERKHSEYCDETYIKMVTESITDETLELRPFIYKKKLSIDPHKEILDKNKILLYVNDNHSIHHIKERGYVESPVRIKNILKELDKTGLFIKGKVSEYPDRMVLNVHNKEYFEYLKNVCKSMSPGKSVYPYVFPIRNAVRAPKLLSVRAGYYCFDTFTPINQNAFLAARAGVNCVLSATDEIISGKPSAYVLTRPPGHHAEKSAFGGFCYFNNCAIAAERLSNIGTVAILDIDYHHGNGQQQIFYHRKDVLTISIHGHPSFAYPYFSGFIDEKGDKDGLGYNYNFPLKERITYEEYNKTLLKCMSLIKKFNPMFLVVALGLDTAKNDPTGTWDFTNEHFNNTGTLIGSLKYPTIIVQEGGYKTHSLGVVAKHFFNGFYKSKYLNNE
ncbi:MAG: acetylpolyamine amidohydrolase [Bacteroidetes bacterium HGW-Bacteroidetes-21]|nr:MAG: acetylpolyamine amidohydrolase [Bacteroidetes bacterium HGW-Bacteroidetes-21]